MGGYGSGRRKQYHITNECFPIDTSLLLKQKLLTGKLRQGATITFTTTSKDLQGNMTEKRHHLHCIVKRNAPGEAGELTKWNAVGQVTLFYGVRIAGEEKGQHCVDL